MTLILKQKTIKDGILYLIQDGSNFQLELKWKEGDRELLYESDNYTSVNKRYVTAH